MPDSKTKIINPAEDHNDLVATKLTLAKLIEHLAVNKNPSITTEQAKSLHSMLRGHEENEG